MERWQEIHTGILNAPLPYSQRDQVFESVALKVDFLQAAGVKSRMITAPLPKSVLKIIDRVMALIAVAAALVINACTGLDPSATTADFTASGAADFEKIVKPLFEHRCAWCHNSEKPNAGLNFEDRAVVLNPPSRFLVPGKPAKSRLYNAVVRDPDHAKLMPADGWGVTDAQKRALHDWIAAGAPWPEGKKGDLRRKDYRVDFDDYL